jgi:hypothetical protein
VGDARVVTEITSRGVGSILLDRLESRQRISRRIPALFVLLRYAAYRRHPSAFARGGRPMRLEATIMVVPPIQGAH